MVFEKVRGSLLWYLVAAILIAFRLRGQVFHSDILNLLSMADMWRSRAPPIPLEFDAIRTGSFVLNRPAQNGSSAPLAKERTNGKNGSASTGRMLNGSSSSTATTASSAGLKDQRALSLQDNLELFVSRCVQLLRSKLALSIHMGMYVALSAWLPVFEQGKILSRLTRMTMTRSTS